MPTLKTVYTSTLHILCCVTLGYGWFFGDENCYRRPNVGCFPTSHPFDNAMGFAPISPSGIGIQFIYKSSRGDLVFPLSLTRRRMSGRFDPTLKTVVIIHGYMEGADRHWVHNMVAQLKRQSPMNIFVVDWSGGSFHFNYLQCVANARMAGALIALFIEDLKRLGAQPDSIHLIGFSLGAHVAGYVGHRVRGIGRITGLDPAGPGFHNTNPSVRLDPSDAALVDVVHTDSNELGERSPIGTIDFYPNGGLNQPGCLSGTINKISHLFTSLDFSRRSVTSAFSCSHIRATELFTASINNNCARSLQRSSSLYAMERSHGQSCNQECPTFGYHLDVSRPSLSGIYRFSTNERHPFC